MAAAYLANAIAWGGNGNVAVITPSLRGTFARDAVILIETVILFWKRFLLDYSPYAADLPDSRVYLTEFK
jgi:hypothetical protein